MDEAVWVSRLHARGEVEQTMRTITKSIRETSEQHVELCRSRCNRDFSNLLSLYKWLDQFDPFETSDVRLCLVV